MAAENHPRNDDYARAFQEKTVPTDTRLAGWAALVQTFGVQALSAARAPYPNSTSRRAAERRGGGAFSTSGTGPASPSATSSDSRCAMKTSTYLS